MTMNRKEIQPTVRPKISISVFFYRTVALCNVTSALDNGRIELLTTVVVWVVSYVMSFFGGRP